MSLAIRAIGYNDNYQSHSGAVPTTISIVPTTSDAVVTQDSTCTSVSNSGTNGIGQFYMFKVSMASGAVTASMPISVQWVNSNAIPYVSNFWIVGPGDFIYTPGTPLTAANFGALQSNPFALSGQFLKRFANGLGMTRGIAGFGFASASIVSEPWEIHQMYGSDGVTPAFSWNNSNKVNYTIHFTAVRALNPSVSQYVYSDFFGLGGTPYNLTLNSSINSTTTTLSINAGSDSYAIPIASLLLLAGTEKMRIRNVAGTTSVLSGTASMSGNTVTGVGTKFTSACCTNG